MQRVVNVSIFLSFVVYSISALFGYLTFYSKNVDVTLHFEFQQRSLKQNTKTKTKN